MDRLTEEAPREEHQEALGSAAEAIDLLYERYLDVVFSYVLYRVPNHAEAEDITAETFGAAFAGFHRFRGDSRPLVWLLGIARQKIIEAARRWQRHRSAELLEVDLTVPQRETLRLLLAADPWQLPEDVALRNEARGVVRQILTRLPELQREALLLQFEQQLSVREIAQVMGRTEAATNSLLQRGRATIFRHGQDYFAS